MPNSQEKSKFLSRRYKESGIVLDTNILHS